MDSIFASYYRGRGPRFGAGVTRNAEHTPPKGPLALPEENPKFDLDVELLVRVRLQGNLTYKKMHPPRTLPEAYA